MRSLRLSFLAIFHNRHHSNSPCQSIKLHKNLTYTARCYHVKLQHQEYTEQCMTEKKNYQKNYIYENTLVWGSLTLTPSRNRMVWQYRIQSSKYNVHVHKPSSFDESVCQAKCSVKSRVAGSREKRQTLLYWAISVYVNHYRASCLSYCMAPSLAHSLIHRAQCSNVYLFSLHQSWKACAHAHCTFQSLIIN